MKTEGALKPCGGSHGRGRADSGQLFADFLIRPTLSSALQYATRPYPGQLLSAYIGLVIFSRPMSVHLSESRLLTSSIWSTRSYLAPAMRYNQVSPGGSGSFDMALPWIFWYLPEQCCQAGQIYAKCADQGHVVRESSSCFI